MSSAIYVLILAGGSGERFWPLSRKSRPKQLLSLFGAETLLEATLRRLDGLVPSKNILILTNEKYNHIVLEQLPMVKPEQVLLEPAMRNTAPCILYASLKIKKQNPDAVMVVAPSDHWIEDEAVFVQNLQHL